MQHRILPSKKKFKQKIRVYGILSLFLLFKTLHDIDEILLWLPLNTNQSQYH